MSFKSQSENHTPPTLGQVISITVDATSRAYDIGALALQGLPAIANDPSLLGDMYVTITSSVAGHFAFGPAPGSATIDETLADAAGAAATMRATAPFPIAAGEKLRYRIDRNWHRFFYIKGSGAGIARLVVSSPADLQ